MADLADIAVALGLPADESAIEIAAAAMSLVDALERADIEAADLRRQVAAQTARGDLALALNATLEAERDDLRRQLAECQSQLAKRHDGDWSMLIEE